MGVGEIDAGRCDVDAKETWSRNDVRHLNELKYFGAAELTYFDCTHPPRLGPALESGERERHVAGLTSWSIGSDRSRT